MTKSLPVFNFLRSVLNGLFHIEASTLFLCTRLFAFSRSTFSVTARKPRWTQEYIVLKLRIPTNSALTTSSGNQVCCNLDSIKAANWGVNFVDLPLLADLLIANCCALIAEYSPSTRFNSLATVEWWTPIKLAILRTEYPSFRKTSIWLRFLW